MPSETVITAKSYKKNFAKKTPTSATSSLPSFDRHPLDLTAKTSVTSNLHRRHRRHRHANFDATRPRACPIKFDSYKANPIAKAYVVLVS